jgi:hypothetical protein
MCDPWQWSASHPDSFTSGERAPGTHWIRGWVGPRSGLDNTEKRTFSTLLGHELRPSSKYNDKMLWWAGLPTTTSCHHQITFTKRHSCSETSPNHPTAMQCHHTTMETIANQKTISVIWFANLLDMENRHATLRKITHHWYEFQNQSW